jgi:hypothetical protein
MKKYLTHLLTGIAIATLAACGGNGSGTSSSSTPSLTGTVAVGAPLAGATVKLKDKNNKTAQVTANAEGSYTFADVTGFVAPVMLEATGTANGKDIALHSVLETVPTGNTAGVLNATPATEAVTAHALKGNPATAFQNPSQISAIDTINLKKAKDNLATALGTTDLFTTSFKADGTGMDKVLDLASFEGNSTEILVVNKTTRTPVAVTKDQTPSSVPAFTLSDAEKNLDTSGIKTLMASLNATLGSASSINSGMPSLISDFYMQEGKNKAAVTNMFATELIGAKYTGYTINGCNAIVSVASAGPTCSVNFSIQLQDLSIAVDSTVVVYDGIAKKWTLFGDQSPFPFDLVPVVRAENAVAANGTISTLPVRFGMNLWIPKAGNSYKSAKLSYSLNGGSSFQTLQLFGLGSGVCSSTSGYLVVAQATAGMPNCSDFFDISDTLANSLNDAAKNGNYKLKIEVYTSADSSGTAAASFVLAGKPQYTSVTGQAAFDNSGISITGTDLGTNAVRFTGSNLDYVDIASTYTNANSATASWGDTSPISKLNGVVSIQKANAQCKANNDDACDQKFSSSSVIPRILLVKLDALGRAVWTNYYQQN